MLFIFILFINILILVERGGIDSGNKLSAILTVTVSIHALVTVIPLKFAEYIIQHGPISYRIYTEEIVGYDRWLDEPQWRVSFDEITDVSRRTTFTDRFLGTRTIDLETENGRELCLAHLSDTGSIYDQLRSSS